MPHLKNQQKLNLSATMKLTSKKKVEMQHNILQTIYMRAI